MLIIQNIMVYNSLYGIKTEKWKTKALANGIYFARLEIGE